jgi:hypothetical protein
MDIESLSPPEGQPTPDQRPGRRFDARAFISVLPGVSFVAMSVTGVVLFVMPPGRIACRTGWRIPALTKDQWDGLHIWFSLLFMVAVLLQNLDLEKAVPKLREKSFAATPAMTLREIASTRGVHPSAMRDILAQ